MATNKPLVSVPIELDKERNIRFDGRALMSMEKILGGSTFEPEFWDEKSMRRTVVILWCGLTHEDKNLELNTVASEVHPGNLEYIAEKIGEALNSAMPDEEDKGDGKDPLPISASR